MASPSGTSTLAPPPPTSTAPNPSSPSQPQANGTAASSQPAAGSTAAATNPLTTNAVPLTSLSDPGTSRRPRDARLIHLLLSSLPLTTYTERVPLQLLDFAYRYTSSVLTDAQHLAAEGYATTAAGNSARANASGKDDGVSLAAVRLSVGSRMGWQFRSAPGKEALLEEAKRGNRVALPRMGGEGYGGGVRLPGEKWVLSGVGWQMSDEWLEEGGGSEDEVMGGKDGGDEEEQGEDGDARMEDIFGEERVGGEGEDRDMADA